MKRRAPIRLVPREPDAEAAAYMAWVRTCPCRVMVAWVSHPFVRHPSIREAPITTCLGQIHAHHAGERGLGQKASDWTCTAFCARHHGEWHDCRGTFAGWGKAQRREWADAQVAATLAEWRRARDQDPDAGIPF